MLHTFSILSVQSSLDMGDDSMADRMAKYELKLLKVSSKDYVYDVINSALYLDFPHIAVCTFIIPIKCIISLHRYFMSSPLFSKVALVLRL